MVPGNLFATIFAFIEKILFLGLLKKQPAGIGSVNGLFALYIYNPLTLLV